MEDLILYLKKLDYDFVLKNENCLEVFIDENLINENLVIIVKKEDEKYLISNAIHGWNFVMGTTNHSLRKNLKVNSIILVFGFIILQVAEILIDFDFIYLVIFGLAVYYSWFFYFLIKFETMKSKIERLLTQ